MRRTTWTITEAPARGLGTILARSERLADGSEVVVVRERGARFGWERRGATVFGQSAAHNLRSLTDALADAERALVRQARR